MIEQPIRGQASEFILADEISGIEKYFMLEERPNTNENLTTLYQKNECH